jgi:hypothetical protein
VGERWWWRNLLGASARHSPSPLASVLCERAAAVPAALGLLAQQGRAVEVVRALASHEALTVLAVVSRIHGVSDLTPSAAVLQSSATVSDPPPASAVSHGDDSRNAVSADRHEPDFAVDAEINSPQRVNELAPPWSRWLSQRTVPRELEPAQACLLGVALVLHQHPEAVRPRSFAAELRRWWVSRHEGRAPMRPGAGASRARPPAPRISTAVESAVHRPPLPPGDRPAGETETPQTTAPHPSVPAQVPTDAQQSVIPAALPAQPPVGDAEWTNPKAASPLSWDPPPAMDEAPPEPVAEVPDIVAPPAPRASKHAGAAASGTVLPAAGNPIVAPRPGAEAGSPDMGLVLENGVETALGGVLFLINMMCAFDLPGCFEDEWRLASTVGAWGVLEALGRALLAGDDANGDDPIWPALAALSGRPVGERLGAGLPRRAAYRLPAAWTAQIPAAQMPAAQLPADGNEPAVWAARAGKLRLWSRAGFVLSETSRDASPGAAQANNEAQLWGLREAFARARFGDAPLAALSGPLMTGVDHALRHWLSLAVPFIRLRLAYALGIDPPVESLREALLARAGRLYVTATHVDLVMEHETVSLPVRLAGLDRSPGWLGEFGRAILFHFE